MRPITLLAIVAFISIYTPAAGGKKHPKLPSPPQQLKAFDYFVGTWICKGKWPKARHEPKDIPVVAKFEIKRDLRGFWYMARYTKKVSKRSPHPYTTSCIMGFETITRQFVIRCVDDMGLYMKLRSNGWKRKRMAFTGSGNLVLGLPWPLRRTFHKKSRGEFRYIRETKNPSVKTRMVKLPGSKERFKMMTAPADKWVVSEESLCKKVRRAF